MSERNKRNRIQRQTSQKAKLLDELDSIKELLIEQKQRLDSESGIPMLDDVIVTASDEKEASIPVLDDVAFPQEEGNIEQKERDESSPASVHPSEQELNKLIDMLVGHRLRKLRPQIKEEVLEELRRIHPEIFQ